MSETPANDPQSDSTPDFETDPAAAALAGVRKNSGRVSRRRKSTSRRSSSRGSSSWSNETEEDRRPKTLDSVLDDLVESRGWAGQSRMAGLIVAWPTIVGADVAEHVSVVGVDEARSCLVLQAESTTWATQIRMLEQLVIERVSEHTGGALTITSVQVQGPAAPTRMKGRLRVPGRGPRDTWG